MARMTEDKNERSLERMTMTHNIRLVSCCDKVLWSELCITTTNMGFNDDQIKEFKDIFECFDQDKDGENTGKAVVASTCVRAVDAPL